MAIQKSDEQKAINKILKLHSKKFPAFAESEFRKEGSSAYELEKLYMKTLDETLVGREKIWAIRNFNYLVYSTIVKSKNFDRDDELDVSMASARTSVAAIFGLHNEQLIDKIVCMEYIEDYFSDQYLESETYAKVSAWVDCCQFVNTLMKYLKKKYPKWSLMSKEEKRNISVYDLMKETSFRDNSSQLQYIVDFLDQDYGLRQKSLAKAHCLLSLKLPNINTLAIAKKVEQYSSLAL